MPANDGTCVQGEAFDHAASQRTEEAFSAASAGKCGHLCQNKHRRKTPVYQRARQNFCEQHAIVLHVAMSLGATVFLGTSKILQSLFIRTPFGNSMWGSLASLVAARVAASRDSLNSLRKTPNAKNQNPRKMPEASRHVLRFQRCSLLHLVLVWVQDVRGLRLFQVYTI